MNFVAFLGWNPGTTQEVFTMDELISAFSLPRIQKGGAVVNLAKMTWFNTQHVSGENHTRMILTTVDRASSVPLMLTRYLDATVAPTDRQRPTAPRAAAEAVSTTYHRLHRFE